MKNRIKVKGRNSLHLKSLNVELYCIPTFVSITCMATIFSKQQELKTTAFSNKWADASYVTIVTL